MTRQAAVDPFKYRTNEDCRNERSGWLEAAAEHGLPVETGCGECSLIYHQPSHLSSGIITPA